MRGFPNAEVRCERRLWVGWKIVITNYHALIRRETTEVSKVGRSLLQGRGEAPVTIETEGAMLARNINDLMVMEVSGANCRAARLR